MSDKGIYSAESVEEALKKALHEMSLPKEAVDIHIISEGSSGFFGLKKSKATIEVTRKSQPPEESWESMLDDYLEKDETSRDRSEKLQLKLEGKAWIKEGSLYFQDTDVQKPLLLIPANITVIKNGVPAEKKTFLTKGDNLEFSLDIPPRETSWSIKVDKKKQVVELKIQPGAYYISTIEDHPPAGQLHLRAETKEMPLNQLTEKDIYDQLDKMEIVEGIQEEEIAKAAITENSGTFVIATGKLPVNGQNGKLDFIIDLREQSGSYKEKLDGTIDFRESIHIPTVTEGTVIASIVEPTPGEDGLSVFGEVLKAKSGKPIQLAPGEGIDIAPDTNEIIALKNGRPHMDQKGQTVRLSILPKLVHRGDLQLADGNIRFIGDVEVLGSVEEQMMVEAAGDIWVHKNIDKGTVQSSSSVTINGNALNSKISAGKSSAIYEEVLHLLKQLLYHYPSFLKVFTQVTQSEAFQTSYSSKNGWGALVKALQEKKFPEVQPAAAALTAYISEHEAFFDAKWRSFSDMLQFGLLTFHHKKAPDPKMFADIQTQAFQFHDILESPSTSESRIALRYTAYSELYCEGEVDILGKGAIHTQIHADGFVTVHQKFIGGKIFAKKGISIKEAGSPGGAKTILETEEGSIILEHVHPDVVITVAGQRMKIREEQFHLNASLDKDQKLKVSYQ